ncbi:MAG: tRNA lysidine(34) synthetase TilS [Lachnospiraceae bacterium]|jgi:tRNA(Ile)-lysidine synthase|nr:tRNA lysidine(34) synthetase TilS [Lachnospiraceae bacterium]
MNPVEEKVFAYIKKHKMLEPGDRVAVGVSGGADSVCLLFLLSKWVKTYGGALCVVHINHMLRTEAKDEAAFVQDLCTRQQIAFFGIQKDVALLAAQMRITTEEAGRMARYDAYSEMKEQFMADKIAVAHTANDQAETMLFHLFRGSGMKGLCAIAPTREDVIRPILCLERREVEDYLRGENQPYCTDGSNHTDLYTRNRIRHHILPFAEEQISHNAIAHMCETARQLSETEDYLVTLTSQAVESVVTRTEKDVRIDRKRFLAMHPAMQKRVLLEVLREWIPQAKDITHLHIESMIKLFDTDGNRRLTLPKGVSSRREYDQIIVEKEDKHHTDREHMRPDHADNLEVIVSLEAIQTREWVTSVYNQISVSFRVSNYDKNKQIVRNKYTKWFDCVKINGNLTLRTRRIGDYFMIKDANNGKIHHKSLKDYMLKEKIPVSKRDHILLLAQGNHVLWVIGHRISEYYKIDDTTKQCLEVEVSTYMDDYS